MPCLSGLVLTRDIVSLTLQCAGDVQYLHADASHANARTRKPNVYPHSGTEYSLTDKEPSRPP